MNTSQKVFNAIAILALALVVGGFLFSSNGGGKVGATVENFPTWYYGGIQIGPSGNIVKNVLVGSCNLAANYSIAATSTGSYSCAVTGATTTDEVFADPSSYQTNAGGGWVITGAVASSTAGFLTFNILNLSGAAAVPPASIASSTEYLIVRH